MKMGRPVANRSRFRTAGTFLAVAFAAFFLAPAAGALAAPHPVTMDDVMRLRMIVGLQAAPVGRDVLLQLQDYPGGAEFEFDLYLYEPGGKLKRLTYAGEGGGAFTWSPDGRKVAFYGERRGKQGIYVLPLDGGEARLAAELPVAAGNLRWRGDRIYFTAKVFPDCGADLDCTSDRLKARESGPSGMVYESLHFRPWNHWRDGRRSNILSLDPATGKIAPVAVGGFDTPPVPFGGRSDYDVAPDGGAVVYTAKKGVDEALSTNTDLFEVKGGKETRITDNPAADMHPAYSPDGAYIAYLTQKVPGYESDKYMLRVYDRKSGQRFTLAEGLDNWIVDFAWGRDSNTLFLLVEEQGHRLVYRVSLDKEARARRISQRYTYRGLAVSGDGRLLYATRENMVQPPDLVAFDLQDRQNKEEKLTDLNKDRLSDVLMPGFREVWYDGAELAGGKRNRVHAFLVMPPGAKPGVKYPLVVMIHGGPQGAWHSAFHPRWTALGIVGHGFAAALINPTGSTGYGQKFVEAVSKDWGGRCYEDIMAFLDFAKTLKGVDATNACAMGGSFGGFMTNWIEGHTDRFKCLVSHSGVSNSESMYGSTDELWFPEWDVGGTPWSNPDEYARWSPVKYAKSFKTPMLVIHGRNDFRVPIEQGLAMFTYLKRLGVEARLLYFPDEDHFVSKPLNRKQWYEQVVDWLGTHLKSK